MKVGFRKPSVKRSIAARTTGKVRRIVKKSMNPLYGKKGMGYINNPRKATYNSVYSKTTAGVSDLVNFRSSTGSRSTYHSSQNMDIALTVRNDNIEQLVKIYPQLVEILSEKYTTRRNWAVGLVVVGLLLLFFVIPLGIVLIIVSIILFSRASKYKKAYYDAQYYIRK